MARMFRVLLLPALLMVGACTTMPTGPGVLVLPGTGKTFDQFRADDYSCRQYADVQLGGTTAAQAANDSGVKSAAIGTAALFALVFLGLFVWSGLLTWAFIVYFIAGGKGQPPLNDVSRMGVGRLAIGAFVFVLLLLILAPVPHRLYDALGIHCPYL